MTTTEERLAHCKVPTGTQSMCFNSGSQRANSTRLMSFATRKISAVNVKTDSVRLSYANNTGAVENLHNNNPAGTNWTNVFYEDGQGDVIPTWTVFNPTVPSDWEKGGVGSTLITQPTWKGSSSICSIYGHVVLKLNGVNTDGLFNLGIFINGKLLGATPTVDSLDSPFMSIARPDIHSTSNQTTSSLTVNLVTQIEEGDYIELKMRYMKVGGSPTDTVSCRFYQANLYIRPIELSGI